MALFLLVLFYFTIIARNLTHIQYIHGVWWLFSNFYSIVCVIANYYRLFFFNFMTDARIMDSVYNVLDKFWMNICWWI